MSALALQKVQSLQENLTTLESTVFSLKQQASQLEEALLFPEDNDKQPKKLDNSIDKQCQCAMEALQEFNASMGVYSDV